MSLNFGKIASLASIINMFAGSSPVNAELITLDENGREDQGRSFQYFPEQINDSKGATYATKSIPGGSHPLYQFITGSERTISFSAIFTNDEDPSPPGILDALQGGLDIGIDDLLGSKYNGPASSAVVWLRSFLYPRYSDPIFKQPYKTVVAPPVARLYLPNSGIHGSVKGNLILDSIDCIMTQCDIIYETFYRNGAQRITVANLTFNETVQTGEDNWGFADGAMFESSWRFGNLGGFDTAYLEPYTK